MEEAASIELHREVKRVGSLALLDSPETLSIITMPLDVHHTVEVGVHDRHGHPDPVGQAVDDDVGPGEVGGWRWGLRYRC